MGCQHCHFLAKSSQFGQTHKREKISTFGRNLGTLLFRSLLHLLAARVALAGVSMPPSAQRAASIADCESNLAGRESPDYPLESPRFRLLGKPLEDKFSCPVMGQKNCHGFGLRSVVKLLANIWPGKAMFLLCDDHGLSPKLAGGKTTSDFLSRRQSEQLHSSCQTLISESKWIPSCCECRVRGTNGKNFGFSAPTLAREFPGESVPVPILTKNWDL